VREGGWLWIGEEVRGGTGENRVVSAEGAFREDRDSSLHLKLSGIWYLTGNRPHVLQQKELSRVKLIQMEKTNSSDLKQI